MKAFNRQHQRTKYIPVPSRLPERKQPRLSFKVNRTYTMRKKLGLLTRGVIEEMTNDFFSQRNDADDISSDKKSTMQRGRSSRCSKSDGCVEQLIRPRTNATNRLRMKYAKGLPIMTKHFIDHYRKYKKPPFKNPRNVPYYRSRPHVTKASSPNRESDGR